MSTQSSEELRQKAKDFLHHTQKNDLQLIWVLGEIHGAKVYKNWGYSSFSDWYKAEGTGSPSLSHAYALARVGRTFLAQREDIERRVNEGELTIRQLMDLASAHEQGKRIEDIIDTLNNPPEKTDTTHKDDPERVREFRFHVAQGDYGKLLCGLINIATYYEVPKLSDAVKSIVFDQSFGILREKYEPYKELIEIGKFFCAACNDVPLTPNFHHIVPVSIAHGYGPQALLCETCHLTTVQAKWKVWAKRWGKKYGFDPDEVEREGQRQANAGDVDTFPSLVITGFPKNISN